MASEYKDVKITSYYEVNFIAKAGRFFFQFEQLIIGLIIF